MVSVMKTEEGPRGRGRRRTRGRRRGRGGEEEEDAEKGGRRGGGAARKRRRRMMMRSRECPEKARTYPIGLISSGKAIMIWKSI